MHLNQKFEAPIVDAYYEFLCYYHYQFVSICFKMRVKKHYDWSCYGLCTGDIKMEVGIRFWAPNLGLAQNMT